MVWAFGQWAWDGGGFWQVAQDGVGFWLPAPGPPALRLPAPRLPAPKGLSKGRHRCHDDCFGGNSRSVTFVLVKIIVVNF